jgi:superoxide reductase
MAEKGKVYVCALCGQEVEVVKSGMGTLVCCGKPMQPKEDE